MSPVIPLLTYRVRECDIKNENPVVQRQQSNRKNHINNYLTLQAPHSPLPLIPPPPPTVFLIEFPPPRQ